jgi:hypothetical protein
MATQAYMQGRKQYGRPQAMLWADNPGTYQNGFYLPNGFEVGSDEYALGTTSESFIILSDDNRQPIDFKSERIEQRKRMVNGRMRSYHVADKITISTSWNMLPSRSHPSYPSFETLTGQSTAVGKTALPRTQQYTSDNGAGGVELLKWYEENPGSFWIYLAYDNYKNFSELNDATPYDNLGKYNQVVEVFFSDFSYTVEKRGGTNYDFWNITVSLEEV